MSSDNDDSVFELALRADLPSPEQEARMRQRILAAGVGLASTGAAVSNQAGAAVSTQAGAGAALGAKLGALSWPATLVLAAVVATPIIALPVWLAPGAQPRSPHARPVPPRASVLSPADEARRAVAPAGPETLAGREAPAREPPSPSAEPRAASRVASLAPAKTATATAVERPASAAFEASRAADSALNAQPAQTPPSTLAAETRLLDRAFAEIAAGHRQAAAGLIAEHEREFPNGLLRQERERARARLNQGANPQ